MTGRGSSPERHAPAALRLEADGEDAARGLGRLVVALLEIVRELLERQALRRVDAGELSAAEVERLGQALLALGDRFAELREYFGVRQEDLRLPADLGELLTEERRGPGEEGKGEV
jgi:hypothetical protein